MGPNPSMPETKPMSEEEIKTGAQPTAPEAPAPVQTQVTQPQELVMPPQTENTPIIESPQASLNRNQPMVQMTAEQREKEANQILEKEAPSSVDQASNLTEKIEELKSEDS